MSELIYKLLRYVVTGGIGAIVDAGVFVLLIKATLGIAPASVISFCVAALVNYRLTSRFVFRRDATLYRFALFLFVALTGLTLNVGITLTGVFFYGLPPLLAKLVGTGAAFFVNFGLNVRVVFGQKRSPTR